MKRAGVILIILMCAVILGGCASEEVETERQVFAMDTIMTFTAYGENGAEGVSQAIALVNSFEKMLDPENELSEVYELNHAGGEPTVVPWQLSEMLEMGSQIYSRSDGRFDLSVYPLVKLWGFVDGEYYVPTEEEVDEAILKVGMSDIEISAFEDSQSSIVKMPAGMQVSFASMAKGFASDYCIAAMKQQGVQSAIISLGGNVQTLGLKPDGSNWNIAIRNPEDTGAYIAVVSVGEAAVVTSGGYQRFFYGDDAEKYHHIINPVTGYPAVTDLESVTVIADSGMEADALSTALFVLGEGIATEYWRTYGGFDMIMITGDGRVVATNTLYEQLELVDSEYELEYVS